jgi:hypothetical protein
VLEEGGHFLVATEEEEGTFPPSVRQGDLDVKHTEDPGSADVFE